MLLQDIQHTAEIYDFIASLAQAARQQPEHALCWWETGATCERRYRLDEQWYNLRPDALAEFRVRLQQVRFWLEWDCGTMYVRDLAIKFTSYAHYVASREWAREHSMLPLLVCFAPDIAQGRRMQRVAQAKLTSPPGVVLWTTTDGLLSEYGPFAPIWLWGVSQGNQPAQSGNVLRQCWFDAIPRKQG